MESSVEMKKLEGKSSLTLGTHNDVGSLSPSRHAN